MTHEYSGVLAATGTRVWHTYQDTPRTPKEARERLAAFLGDRGGRRLGEVREVRGEQRDGQMVYVVRLYSTDVVTYYPNGVIVLDWGGWHTLTTNTTINDHLPLFYGVSGHARVHVQTPRRDGDREWDLWYWPVPRKALVRISPRGIVSYKRYAGEDDTAWTRAERFDDWRAADRAAKKLEAGR